ncbi:hypothetical protein PHET_09431 [Paragonimus heterotremus]|uniref:Uncharacterized protein n=1 Tax=Paragonimus heterotremus TaxID=100268 RepID=A0A8J4SZ89_9TREM|nr:hypothetical protein PHET_09431 [Paragonimus heterotremus]
MTEAAVVIHTGWVTGSNLFKRIQCTANQYTQYRLKITYSGPYQEHSVHVHEVYGRLCLLSANPSETFGEAMTSFLEVTEVSDGVASYATSPVTYEPKLLL